VDERVGVH